MTSSSICLSLVHSSTYSFISISNSYSFVFFNVLFSSFSSFLFEWSSLFNSLTCLFKLFCMCYPPCPNKLEGYPKSKSLLKFVVLLDVDEKSPVYYDTRSSSIYYSFLWISVSNFLTLVFNFTFSCLTAFDYALNWIISFYKHSLSLL